VRWLTGSFVLLVGCPWPFKGYEVAILPEEVALKTIERISWGLERRDLDEIVSVYAHDFHAPGHDAGRWEPVRDAPGLHLRRWVPAGRAADLDRAGIRAWWGAYLDGFRSIARVEHKPRLMQMREPESECTVYVNVRGVDADGRFRVDHLWIRFAIRSGQGPWVITDQRVVSAESAVGTRSRFRDVAREAGAAYLHRPAGRFGPQDMAANSFPLVVRGDSGVAAADVDGDGWVDLYYCDGVRNALLRNRRDGTFEDVTERSGLAGPQGVSRSALFADFDNDGDLDLFVTYEHDPCRLYENRGNGAFRERGAESGVAFRGFATSAAAADFDNDGLLDLYVGCYGDHSNRYPELRSKNGDPNVLFRNRGGLRFEDVTASEGVGDRGWTLAVTWGDYDGDGDPDLLVCNDFGANTLYRNDGGRFTDVTAPSGVAVDGFGMSAAFGDYDNDGDLDLYLAGMYSNAGQWIFRREELLPGDLLKPWRERVLGTLDYMTDGNRLLRNDGNGRFSEVARQAGVDYGQFAWGSPWVDFDNDGHLDLYCCNGYWSGVSPEDT
jgi:hypothetical protein